MEVILLERIEKLGQMGDVVKVKAGYARNYLLPQKKAVTATEDNKTHFESQRAQLEARNLEQRAEAEKVAEKMEGAQVVMIRQAGEAGQLYGSVSARDIASGLTEAGYSVSRQQVRLDDPIKAIGLFPVHVALHPEVLVTVEANVARSLDEAEIQERTGEAVVGRDDEPEAAPEAIEAAAEELFEEGAAPEDLDPSGLEEEADESAAGAAVSGDNAGAGASAAAASGNHDEGDDKPA